MSISWVVSMSPALVVGDDLSTALIITGAILVSVLMLPFVLSWLEPPRIEQPRHLDRDARLPRRIR